MIKYGIVYKITNKINGKAYIGQTKTPFEVRFASHKTCNSVIGSALRKYCPENFTTEVLAVAFDAEALNEAENRLINIYQCRVPHGYNVMVDSNYIKPSIIPPEESEYPYCRLTDRPIAPKTKEFYKLHVEFERRATYVNYWGSGELDLQGMFLDMAKAWPKDKVHLLPSYVKKLFIKTPINYTPFTAEVV